MSFTKITLPLHWKAALDSALEAFARDGFIYLTQNREELPSGHIVLEVAATEEQMLNLGVKIGYRLPVKITESERSNAIQCIQIVIDTISKNDPDTVEQLQIAIKKLQQI